jgi:hypothetical protein
MEDLLLKSPYKVKNSSGGTPEPQTPQDAPWLRGPSLKILRAGWDSFKGALRHCKIFRYYSDIILPGTTAVYRENPVENFPRQKSHPRQKPPPHTPPDSGRRVCPHLLV